MHRAGPVSVALHSVSLPSCSVIFSKHLLSTNCMPGPVLSPGLPEGSSEMRIGHVPFLLTLSGFSFPLGSSADPPLLLPGLCGPALALPPLPAVSPVDTEAFAATGPLPTQFPPPAMPFPALLHLASPSDLHQLKCDFSPCRPTDLVPLTPTSWHSSGFSQDLL